MMEDRDVPWRSREKKVEEGKWPGEAMENMHQDKGIFSFFNSTKVFCERVYMCLNEGGQKSKLHGLTKQMALQEREEREKQGNGVAAQGRKWWRKWFERVIRSRKSKRKEREVLQREEGVCSQGLEKEQPQGGHVEDWKTVEE